jgi:hypothetical protein
MPRIPGALLAAAAALACALPASAQAPAAPADTAVSADSAFSADPAGDFVRDLADPVEAGVALGLGVYDHLRTHPAEWGGGADALLQRVASRAGGHVVGTSVRHGLAAALGRSTRWEPCGCTTVEERVEHVFLETFTDLDRSGRRVLSEPYLAGTLAASLAPAAWHPEVSLRDGLVSAGLSVVFTLASRVALELVPAP